MKKTVFYLCVFFCITALIATACVRAKYTPAKNAGKYPKSESVQLFKNFPDSGYKIIGTITATGKSKEKIIEKIRARAVKEGAHAVVIKPPAEYSTRYTSEMRTEFADSEWKYEAVFIRFDE